MLADFVVFTRTVEFRISFMYMGGVPEAKHDKVYPDNVRTTGSGEIALGGADEKRN